jgi:predicted RNA binding protein YcfA (HicA-like mRNA interferase family)
MAASTSRARSSPANTARHSAAGQASDSKETMRATLGHRPLHTQYTGAATRDSQIVGKYSKSRQKLLSGSSDTNVEFSVLCQLLVRLGFDERIKGSHHIFTRDGVMEILNLQPKGSKAKPYQVKQVRGILVKYQLGEADVD